MDPALAKFLERLRVDRLEAEAREAGAFQRTPAKSPGVDNSYCYDCHAEPCRCDAIYETGVERRRGG